MKSSAFRTENLQLLPVERAHVEALLRHKSELAALLQMTVPDGWPSFPEAFSLAGDAASQSSRFATDWGGYFFIHPLAGALVGNGGFKGPPSPSGSVEIGYEIASEYRNRGFATEAVKGLLDRAFSFEEPRAVIAHTLAEMNASNAVLRKAGMRFDGEQQDSEVGKIWRWRISRNDYYSQIF